MFKCKNVFWLENIPELFCNYNILPLTNKYNSESFENKMNIITRFILFIFLIILFLGNFTISIIFLLFSLLIIIIIYYIQKRTMNKQIETYQNYEYNNKKNYQQNTISPDDNLNSVNITYNTPDKTSIKLPEPSVNFQKLTDQYLNCKNNTYTKGLIGCCDYTDLIPGPDFVSLNQNLVGKANKKTLIPPVVTPPICDLDFWKENNFINHSRINTESQHDTYLSGYKVSNCCDTFNCTPKISCQQNPNQITENYNLYNDGLYEGVVDDFHRIVKPNKPIHQNIVSPVITTINPNAKIINHDGKTYIDDTIEGYSLLNTGPDTSIKYNQQIISPLITTINPNAKIINHNETKNGMPYNQENFEYPYDSQISHNNIELPYIKENESGWVNTSCGYNPLQIHESNLPSNLQSGKCDSSIELKRYNKNLFTQTIQPGVYTNNEIIEPINSNIGISFTQQFEPKSCLVDQNGINYTEHDPMTYTNTYTTNDINTSIAEHNIYDPRFTGYGTSYRSYTDKNLGNTKFYYDDINSVKMPNYLVRSNIDFAMYADSYGPLSNENKNGNINTDNIRSLAQDSFLRASLEQRNSLSESLMRKRNSELWQLRKFPSRTFGGTSRNKC